MSMRNILIPVVAGLLFSPALMAADITATSGTSPTSESDEWLATADSADKVLGGVLKVTLGAEYAVGDIITLTFSGAALETGTLSSITSDLNAAISSVTIGRLTADASTATYRVSTVTPPIAPAPAPTVGAVFTLASAAAPSILEFDAPSVDAAGTIVVAYAAATNTGLALDTSGGPVGGGCEVSACNSVDYITTGAQYDATVTVAFDGVIDVDDNRETFEGASKIDFMTVAPVDDAGMFDKSATLTGTGYDIVVTGDFSFLVDSDPMTPELDLIAGVVVVTGGTCTGMVVTITDVSYNCPGPTTAASTVTVNLTLNVSGDPPEPAILPAGAFTITVTANFTGIGGTGDKLLLSGSAGAWILNGFQAFLPYVPYGPGISQVIYVVNRGLKSGDITVDWVDANGNTGSLGAIANLAATTVLSLGPTIQAALPTAQSDNGRLALTITANVPAKDVQINSQYNVSGNRAFIASEDNRPHTSIH